MYQNQPLAYLLLIKHFALVNKTAYKLIFQGFFCSFSSIALKILSSSSFETVLSVFVFLDFFTSSLQLLIYRDKMIEIPGLGCDFRTNIRAFCLVFAAKLKLCWLCTIFMYFIVHIFS
jgi:hypothetical protein